MPSGGTAEEAAARAYRVLEGANLLENTRVYYLGLDNMVRELRGALLAPGPASAIHAAMGGS